MVCDVYLQKVCILKKKDAIKILALFLLALADVTHSFYVNNSNKNLIYVKAHIIAVNVNNLVLLFNVILYLVKSYCQ